MNKKSIKDNMTSSERMEKYLEGKTSPEESLNIIEEAAFDPEMEEAIVMHKRLNYSKDILDEYGQFIPSGDKIADDGEGLCDLKCEAYILRQEGVTVEESLLAEESRNNYWLRDGGTPLHKMGKLLERKGFLVNRFSGASIDKLQEDLKTYKVIVVVNGDTLSGVVPNIFDEDFNLDNNPNHAIVVLAIDRQNGIGYNNQNNRFPIRNDGLLHQQIIFEERAGTHRWLTAYSRKRSHTNSVSISAT